MALVSVTELGLDVAKCIKCGEKFHQSHKGTTRRTCGKHAYIDKHKDFRQFYQVISKNFQNPIYQNDSQSVVRTHLDERPDKWWGY